MIHVGIAGIGFMGMIHYLSYRKVRGAKVTALCEQDRKRLAGDWRDIQGNFGPAGTKMDLSGIDRYADLDELMADPKIDLVDVCLPPAWHAEATVKALAAGKHVFCEKPMALTTAECRRMTAAAEKAGKLLLIGHVLPLFPEYEFAYKTVAGGKYGRLLGGHFKRVISDPPWLPDFYDPRKIGGPMLDLHVHDAHFIRLLFGMPVSVTSRGRMRGEVVEYCSTLFQLDDPALTASATTGVINQQGRPFTHGFEIHLERATLLFEFAVIGGKGQVLMPCTLLTDKGKVIRPKLGSGDPVDAFGKEIKEVIRAIRTGDGSPILAADLARDAIVLCHKQTASVRTGRTVRV